MLHYVDHDLNAEIPCLKVEGMMCKARQVRDTKAVWMLLFPSTILCNPVSMDQALEPLVSTYTYPRSSIQKDRIAFDI